uniref:XPG N-terminal domain-containing protein n=1 Tax=viral metagenome TaxID=1070528 RepID=A0A6C0K138_9ZZZZ
MGIKNLHGFLRKLCPSVYNTIPISKYAFKKIAIDTSIFMCKYKSASGQYYLDSFLNLISILRYHEVHFVFVYDTKAPPEKDNEKKQRLEAREKNKLRVDKIETIWNLLKEEKQLSEESVFGTEEDRENVEDEALNNFLAKMLDADEGECITVRKIDMEIQKLKNTVMSIRTEDFLLTKEFFKACNIPVIDAEGEAEATASALVKQGIVAAVLTEDTDVLAYSVPFMLHKMDMSEGTFIEVDYEEILNQLKLTSAQFLDLCILCGTDYNTNMFKVGPDRAYKLLMQYGSIEGIARHQPNLPVSVLNHEKSRSLFLHSIDLSGVQIPYCGFPNKNELENLYFVNNCKFSLDRLYNSFLHSVFHDFELKPSSSGEEEERPSRKIMLLTQGNGNVIYSSSPPPTVDHLKTS